MECPVCKKELEKAILHDIEIDYCPKCFSVWFDEDELRQVKDTRDPELNWVDIDLWRDKKKFEISKGGILCPKCRMPLYEVKYDKSRTQVDLCSLCQGVWLNRGEFRRIIKYLKEKSDYEVLYHFSRSLMQEFGEIFIGPEELRSEVVDFLSLLKLLSYKFRTQHLHIAEAIRVIIPK